MLSHWLRLLESHPEQDIQPALVEDPDRRAIYHRLARVGALRRTRRATEIFCPECFKQRVTPQRGPEGEMVQCLYCGPIPLDPGYTDVYSVHLPWLFAQIGTCLPPSVAVGAAELEPEVLWRVAKLRRQAKTVDVMFARISEAVWQKRIRVESTLR
jgi:hypothetical protein